VFRRSYAASASATCSEMSLTISILEIAICSAIRVARSLFDVCPVGDIGRGDGDCVSPRSTKGVPAAGVDSELEFDDWGALPFVRGAGAMIVV
jgi:hypothetical protein